MAEAFFAASRFSYKTYQLAEHGNLAAGVTDAAGVGGSLAGRSPALRSAAY